MKKLDIDEIAKTNPNVDAKQVKETLRLLKQLRAAGVERQEYSIVPPLSDSIRILQAEKD